MYDNDIVIHKTLLCLLIPDVLSTFISHADGDRVVVIIDNTVHSQSTNYETAYIQCEKIHLDTDVQCLYKSGDCTQGQPAPLHSQPLIELIE